MALTTVPVELASLDGAVTVNESSADVDFRIESNGNANMLFVNGGNDQVGIGADPSALFHVTHGGGGFDEVARLTSVANSAGDGAFLGFHGNSTSKFYGFVGGYDIGTNEGGVKIGVGNGETAIADSMTALTINNDKKVLIGTTGTRNAVGVNSVLSIEGTGYDSSSITMIANSADSNGAYLMIGKSRGSSLGSSTALNNGDQIGGVYFVAADGTDVQHAAAYITANIYGDVGSNDVPGMLRFFTTPDGSATPTEKVRIPPSGGITFNGDTSTANALDDYEEGTWTPVLSSTGSMTVSNAKYTKIGNLVTITANVYAFTNRSSTSSLGIQGLPFTKSSGSGSAVGSVIGRNLDVDCSGSYVSDTGTIVYFYIVSSGAYTNLRHADLNSTDSDFHFTLTYRV